MFKKFFQLLILPLDFITKYFKALVLLLILIFICIALIPQDTELKAPNLAKIYLQGPILDSHSIYEQIEKISKTPSIQGVLLLIDSPGGAMGASVEISDMISELKKKMPVVVYVQGAMASGSYYAGMYADKIYANRAALIGSIGVVFSSFDIQDLIHKLGIKAQGIAAGEYKEVGTFMRQWTPKERAFLQDLIQEEYQMFVSDVADARGLEVKNSTQYAQGKVFTAAKALKLGLIDVIGTQNDAIETLKNLSQVTDPIWLKKDKFEAFVDKIIKTTTQISLQALTQQLH
ncbi:endopeptidase IV [Helicobacter sp. 12S02634-8]|uniref:signal peptide peptidase SppA n=1 Tax=Helicobacter sp. 12S02634-8 TaxID=1476199 RepID=UPI000BA624D5|nr:signal peptide peptidase SppA [Helicobacter sp. 12S02634-8]PAF48579.1 endopeptidase IV [Helicobacter sp. 12S02634-8]